MIKNRILISGALFILSLIFVGCSDTQQSDLDGIKQEMSDLKTEIAELKTEILMQNTKSNEGNKNNTNIEDFVAEFEKMNDELLTLKESIVLNTYHEDLTDLNTYESIKFEEFRLSYDDEFLIDLDPISICKMYLYASLIKDYETQYELYTTNEGGFFWSKEEDLNIPNKRRMSDYTMFEDVYNLNVELKGENEDLATITWFSKNRVYINGFSLQKHGDVWKVSFVPMQ